MPRTQGEVELGLHAFLFSALNGKTDQLHGFDIFRWYPMNRTLGGPHSQSGRFWKYIKLFPLPGIELQFLGLPVRSYRSTNYFIPNIVEEEKKGELVGGIVGLFLLDVGGGKVRTSLC